MEGAQAHGYGAALLRYRGMWAWAQAAQQLAVSVPPGCAPSSTESIRLSGPLNGAVVQVLAGMVLSIQAGV